MEEGRLKLTLVLEFDALSELDVSPPEGVEKFDPLLAEVGDCNRIGVRDYVGDCIEVTDEGAFTLFLEAPDGRKVELTRKEVGLDP